MGAGSKQWLSADKEPRLVLLVASALMQHAREGSMTKWPFCSLSRLFGYCETLLAYQVCIDTEVRGTLLTTRGSRSNKGLQKALKLLGSHREQDFDSEVCSRELQCQLLFSMGQP